MDLYCDFAGLDNCSDKMSVSGLERIYFAKASEVKSNNIIYDVNGYIIGYSGSAFTWRKYLFDYLKSDWKQEMIHDANGVAFNLMFSTQATKITLQNKKVFEALIHQRIVILFRDHNQNWTLSGLGAGYRMSKYFTTTSAQKNSFNGQTLEFTAQSRCNFQEVLDPESFWSFDDNPTPPVVCPDCTSLVSAYCSYSYVSCCAAAY